MKILFINTNQIVQKLVEVTAQKANVELVSVSEAKQVGDIEQYDYIIADDDCYNLEKEQFDALIKGHRACLIYSKRDGMVSGFSEYIKKPFIPTHVLDIILQEIAKLQTKEDFNTPKQETQEQTPQEQEVSNQEAPESTSAQHQESQESSEPLSDLSVLSKELNLEIAESHEPSEDNEEKSEKIDTQDLLNDLNLELPDDKELDELSSLQNTDIKTFEKDKKEKLSLDSINFNEDERDESSPMEDLDALLAGVDGLDEVALDDKQSTQESEQNSTQQDEAKDLESVLAQEGAQEQNTQASAENIESDEINLEDLDLENLEEVSSASAQSPQVLDSAQLGEVSDLLHEIESPSKTAQSEDSMQDDSADESSKSVQEPQSAQDENLESLDLGLEDINLDNLEIPTDTFEDNKELDANEFGDLELGEDLGMASLDDLKAELEEDSEDFKEASNLTESVESNEAFFTQDENQAQPTQTSENESDENELGDENLSDDSRADDEGKMESLDVQSAQDSEISEIDMTSLSDLDTAEIQSLENENLEVSDTLPDELAPHLENTAQEEQSHAQNDDLVDLESLRDLDMQGAQAESQSHKQESKEEDSKASQIGEEPIESMQDFQSLSENEVRQALGEAIDESAEAQNLASTQNATSATSAENIESVQSDSKDMQIDEVMLPKEIQAHQNTLEELSNSLSKTISQSLQNIQSSETRELLNGLEVTINISFKDKHND